MVRSDINHICLQRVNATLSLIKKHKHYTENEIEQDDEESSSTSSISITIGDELHNIQENLRNDILFDSYIIVNPFLRLLKAPFYSAPFKLSALEFINTLINSDILLDTTTSSVLQSKDSETLLSDIVDAIVNCKFVQTDLQIDEIVQFNIVETLYRIITAPIRTKLNNETFWKIIEKSHATIIQMNAFNSSSSLSQNSQKVLYTALGSLFELSTNKNNNIGLPCILKCMTYFIHILEVYISNLDNNILKQSSAVVSSSITPSLSHNSLSLLVGNLDSNNNSTDEPNFQIFIAIKSLHCILLGNGNLQITRQIIANCSPLLNLCLDDIPKCAILLCTSKPTVGVLLTILPFIQTLIQLFLPRQKVLIECVMLHIYMKSIHQLKLLLDEDLKFKYANKEQSGESNRISPISTSMDTESISIILESLIDLISDHSFIPALFMSFDCDPSKPDIVIPLFNMLIYISKFALRSNPKNNNNNNDNYSSNNDNPQQSYEDNQLSKLANLAFSCVLKFIDTMNKRTELASHITENLTSENLTENLTENLNSENLTSEKLLSNDNISIYELSRYFTMNRQAKFILSEACHRFIQKPSQGIAYLQDKNVVETPINSITIARFLRVCTSLPKENIGSFLGELGKEHSKNEVDSKQFHAELLLSYVKTFEFNGQSLLNCMRIFLTAFRLPGEAQQIDRILVAFSEHCHSHCIEGQNGILENSEVTYLLTFSIIMLQTDRHNPNIREERKMTLEQFIRNNTNYGNDVKQTKDLPRDFLTAIFYDISNHPLRTERNDYSAIMRIETWQELQLSTSADYTLSFFATTGYSSDILALLCGQLPTLNDENIMNLNCASCDESAAAFLHEKNKMKILYISSHIYAQHGLMDSEILQCLWTKLVYIGFIPFMPVLQFYDLGINEIQQNSDANLIRVGIDILLFIMRSAHVYAMQSVIDMIILMFATFTGAFHETIYDQLLVILGENWTSNNDPKIPIEMTQNSHDFVTICINFLNIQLKSITARTALGTLLHFVNHNSNYLSKYSWKVIFYILGLLRDCSLLSDDLLIDHDTDFLPLISRSEFDFKMTENVKNMYTDLRRSFGIKLISQQYLQTNNDTDCPIRWDDGYNGKSSPHGINRLILQICSSEAESVESFTSGFTNLKQIIQNCDIGAIFNSTRFLSETLLLQFLDSLMLACASWYPHTYTAENSDSNTTSTTDIMVNDEDDELYILYNQFFSTNNNHQQQQKNYLASSNTCAWYEMILVDIIVRNRDRFLVMWPIISLHYQQLHKNSEMTYINERRIVSVFKLSSRMLSRRQLSTPIIDLLYKIFQDNTEKNTAFTDHASQDTIFFQQVAGQISTGMFRLFTNNVSYLPQLRLNQWQVLFDIIAIGSKTGGFGAVKAFESMAWLLHEPRLRAEVPVFCICSIQPLVGNIHVPISVSLGALQLLQQLHSRLEVLFQDTLGNNDTNNIEESTTSNYVDAPLLWESCWTPILHSLYDGISDTRIEIRSSALVILFDCVLDEHSNAAPPTILINIISNILLPCVSKLVKLLVEKDAAIILISSSAIIIEQDSTKLAILDSNLAIFAFHRLSLLFSTNLTRISKSSYFVKFWVELLDFAKDIFSKLDQNLSVTEPNITATENVAEEVQKTIFVAIQMFQNIVDMSLKLRLFEGNKNESKLKVLSSGLITLLKHRNV